MKSLLKVYIVLVVLNLAGFLIFETVFLGSSTTLCLKKYHKSERHLRLMTHIFTKLSQNVCLVNTHILVYQHARCGRELGGGKFINP